MATVPERNSSQRDVEELRKAVYILAEQVGRYMAEKQMKGNQDRKETLSQRFVEEVALMAVVDAIKSKRPALKALWTVVFLITFSTTAYLVYKVVDEYRHNPTATKVEILRNSTYAFPPIILCIDSWFSVQKAIELGFTRDALQYALNYLVRYDNIQREYNAQCDNWTKGEKEFIQAYNRSGLPTLIDFYKHIALDAVSNDQFDPSSITFDCAGCEETSITLTKLVIDRGVCYLVPLQTETGKLRGSSGLWRLVIRVPDLTDGLLELKPYWRLYINTELAQVQPTSVYLSIDKTTSTAITVHEQRFRTVDTVDEPCARGRDSQSGCSTKCLSEKARTQLGCRLLSLERETYHRSPTEYCNRCSWKESGQEMNEDADEPVHACLHTCPHQCETWMYDGTVDKHWSASIDAKLQAINSRSEVKFDSAKIFFKNGAVLRGGIVTYTEVFTYSLETLIGTIGGTCGIWISVSVLTLVQLVVFFVQVILSRGAKVGKMIMKKPGDTVQMTGVYSSSNNVTQTQSAPM